MVKEKEKSTTKSKSKRTSKGQGARARARAIEGEGHGRGGEELVYMMCVGKRVGTNALSGCVCEELARARVCAGS